LSKITEKDYQHEKNEVCSRSQWVLSAANKSEAHQKVFKAVCVLMQVDLKVHPLMEVYFLLANSIFTAQINGQQTLYS
jgi:hypothetical protein